MPAASFISSLLNMRLRLVVACGLVLALAALPAAIFWALLPAELLLLGGIQLAALGVIAEYLAFTLPAAQRALEPQLPHA